ncbi:MAG: hypothetical protein ACOYJS_01495 [Acutalibacteraceae bacterium]
MFKKMKLKKEIKKLKQEIVSLENKRARSQSALVANILQKKEPDEKDVEFFNAYSKQIDDIRAVISQKEKELSEL